MKHRLRKLHKVLYLLPADLVPQRLSTTQRQHARCCLHFEARAGYVRGMVGKQLELRKHVYVAAAIEIKLNK